MTMKARTLYAALGLAIILPVACVKSTNTTPATPAQAPQITVEQYLNLAAAADNAAAHELVGLCLTPAGATAPVLDSATCSQVKTYLTAVVKVIDQASAEAASSDPWSCSVTGAPANCTAAQTIRAKIANLFATAALNVTVTNPTLLAALASLQSIINQVLGVI